MAEVGDLHWAAVDVVDDKWEDGRFADATGGREGALGTTGGADWDAKHAAFDVGAVFVAAGALEIPESGHKFTLKD